MSDYKVKLVIKLKNGAELEVTEIITATSDVAALADLGARLQWCAVEVTSDAINNS